MSPREEDRGRSVAVYAAVVAVVVAEHRPATAADVRDIIDVGRTTLDATLRALVAVGRLRRLRTWSHDAGPRDRPRHVYVPADPLLAGGVGRCSTEGCGADPELVVAGHALCRRCARGPIDPVRGGGQFREDTVEAVAIFHLVAGHRSSVDSAGGWEPTDGGEVCTAERRHKP